LTGKPFYCIGVNAYYLQNLAAYGDTFHLIETMQSAKALGITTIRTWGFFDSDDSNNAAVIQYAPGMFNERGLRALDYVLAKAKEYSFRLVIPLINSWDDYGGMNQYVEWLAARTPANNKEGTPRQQYVYGAEGRRYRIYVSSGRSHDDFYSNDTMKQWYKNYLQTILLRVNTFTGIQYKDEPAILGWELANEPRSLERSGELVYGWLDEMSSYLKTIDHNHLVSTGEEGFDVLREGYSDISTYNQQSWLFDGSNGISYSKNVTLPAIDFASIHCYPEAWHLPSQSSIVWMNDHQRIAREANKPLVFGEFGAFQSRSLVYQVVFNEAYYQDISGILLWQFTYLGRRNNDGYAFSCPSEEQVCPVLTTYSYKFELKRNGQGSNPSAVRFYQNYPNPFNIMTVISYDLPVKNMVKLEIFNGVGTLVESFAEEEQESGNHQVLFDAANHASGIYYVRLSVSGNKMVKKVVLVK
ncbi:MAG: T9SS type A sorting domain-containing protein, partial [Bacteroidetes bacterium]